MDESSKIISSNAKESIGGTIFWLQAGAYLGFISAGLSIVAIFLGGGANGIVSIAIGIYLAVLLLNQSNKLKGYMSSGSMKSYEESLAHENNYWMTLMILSIIGIVALVLVLIIILVFIVLAMAK